MTYYLSFKKKKKLNHVCLALAFLLAQASQAKLKHTLLLLFYHFFSFYFCSKTLLCIFLVFVDFFI